MEKLDELKKRLDKAKEEYISILNIYKNRTNFVLMYLNKSGKHTFALQPIKQIKNLEANGWEVITKKDLNSIFEVYGID